MDAGVGENDTDLPKCGDVAGPVDCKPGQPALPSTPTPGLITLTSLALGKLGQLAESIYVGTVETFFGGSNANAPGMDTETIPRQTYREQVEGIVLGGPGPKVKFRFNLNPQKALKKKLKRKRRLPYEKPAVTTTRKASKKQLATARGEIKARAGKEVSRGRGLLEHVKVERKRSERELNKVTRKTVTKEASKERRSKIRKKRSVTIGNSKLVALCIERSRLEMKLGAKP